MTLTTIIHRRISENYFTPTHREHWLTMLRKSDTGQLRSSWPSTGVRIEVIGMIRIRSQAIALVVLMILACRHALPLVGADTKAAASSPAPSPEAVSAKTAFWQMYKMAHTWATDLVPLKLESKQLAGTKSGGGKFVMWTATFGSLKLHQARVFTYSAVAKGPDIRKGVIVSNPLPWPGPTRDALPFDTGDFAVDSDAIYNTAFSQASAWAKAHPDKDVSFSLGNASRFSGPVWYVLWGDSKSGYYVYVSAKTGSVVSPKK